MKKLTLLISLLSLSFAAGAGNRAATSTMQVSLVIAETCNVQSNTDRPDVSCRHDSPYLVKRGDNLAAAPAAAATAPAAAVRAGDDARTWTITF